MPAQLIFDPWTLAFLLALFALLGALCTYLGALVYDRDDFLSHDLFAMYRDGWNRRLSQLENWKKRFIAHHNAEHAGRNPYDGPNLVINRERADIDRVEGIVQRHDHAINGLVAANGEFNGLKAFVDAINTVQAKQEDRLAKTEREMHIVDRFVLDATTRIEALERAKGPRKSGR